MKFDVIFTNPPYNRGMDLKILNEVVGQASEVVAVHPSISLIELKGNKLFQSFKKNKFKSIEFFNGNEVFNIGLFYPCMISHMSANHSGDIEVKWFNDLFMVKDPNDITVYSTSWDSLVKPFYSKIVNVCAVDNVWNHNNLSIDDTKHHCQLAAIIGHVAQGKQNTKHMNRDDFYTMVMRESDRNKGIRQPNLDRPGNPTPTFEFDTEAERDNFIEYLKTDFARFCLSLLKNNANLAVGELSLIPWMDFKEAWDDDKLYKHFDIADDMQEYIRDFIPDYYGIR